MQGVVIPKFTYQQVYCPKFFEYMIYPSDQYFNWAMWRVNNFMVYGMSYMPIFWFDIFKVTDSDVINRFSGIDLSTTSLMSLKKLTSRTLNFQLCVARIHAISFYFAWGCIFPYLQEVVKCKQY